MTTIDPIAAAIPSPVTRPPAASSPPESNLFVVDGVSWDLYEHIIAELPRVRVTFDNGRMALMSPLPIHERIKSMVARMIELTSLELDIPCCTLGSTTWKRKELAKGLEADECYFVQHASSIRGRTDAGLRDEVAPDLAIEVDISHHPMDRLSIYAALGVNEVWHFDGEQIRFVKLSASGSYESTDRSEAFPMLSTAIINEYLSKMPTLDEHGVMLAFRDWLRSLPGAS